MRVVEGGLGPADAYVIIGDGGRDVRVFRAIAEKFDHKKIIRVPDLPIRDRKLVKEFVGKGLVTAIRRLAVLIEYVKTTKYLIIIDKEHVLGGLNEVIQRLKEYGFETSHSQSLIEGCWRLYVRRDNKEVVVYVVTLGRIKCIEENLAELIRLLYGEQVEESKNAINRWLKKKEKNDEDIVREASRETLRKAFPQVIKALEEISRN